MKNECANPILITGGYGVVGSQIAKIIRQCHPVIPILLAGRNPASAQTLIESLGNAKSVTIDVESEAPLANLPITPSVVLNVVNDTHNYLLLDCVNKGIGYIDITRWTERMREAIVQVTMKNNLRAPVKFG
jgi:saccharopine dehydrogenase-like NADP-dependent oxidoreductase